MLNRPEGKPILVPLTTSLYVPGTIADSGNVIIDVGTGFYVGKVLLPPHLIRFKRHFSYCTSQSTKDATLFYSARIEDLSTNLKDLESIVQGKSKNLRVVEDGKL